MRKKEYKGGTDVDILMILLIAVSLAMDAFAVSVSNGVSVRGFGVTEAIKQGLYFGVFQFLMPVLGWLLGSSVRVYIEAVDHWIAFGLLALIGVNMIRESRREEEASEGVALTAKVLVVQAIATSIDALAVGISFAVLQVNLLQAAVIIGVVAFVFSVIGGGLGKRIGGFLQNKAELAGGIVLLLIGCKILVEHLFFAG